MDTFLAFSFLDYIYELTKPICDFYLSHSLGWRIVLPIMIFWFLYRPIYWKKAYEKDYKKLKKAYEKDYKKLVENREQKDELREKLEILIDAHNKNQTMEFYQSLKILVDTSSKLMAESGLISKEDIYSFKNPPENIDWNHYQLNKLREIMNSKLNW